VMLIMVLQTIMWWNGLTLVYYWLHHLACPNGLAWCFTQHNA
jgi:hypothetical protein